MEEHKTNVTPAVVAVALLLPVVLYVGSYLALAKAVPLSRMAGQGPWRKRAVYSAGGVYAEYLFAPANWADRRLRQRHWEWHTGDRREKP